MTRRANVFLAVVLVVSACSSDNSGVTTPSSTSPTTETFASRLYKGRAWRTFTASTSGRVNVTLTTVGPHSVPIGLGLGIPGNGSTCILSISLVTEGGTTPQISEHVDPGDYCAEVHDVGNVVDFVSFSVAIEYP